MPKRAREDAPEPPPAVAEAPPPTLLALRARILELAQRARGSICPSAVARSFARDRARWAPLMPLVRRAAAELVAEGAARGPSAARLLCTQRGLDAGDPTLARGPIRLQWRAQPPVR
jgi:hypothetical protein